MINSEQLADLLYHSLLPRETKMAWLELLPEMNNEEISQLIRFLLWEKREVEILDEQLALYYLKDIVQARYAFTLELEKFTRLSLRLFKKKKLKNIEELLRKYDQF